MISTECIEIIISYSYDYLLPSILLSNITESFALFDDIY